MVFRRGRVVAEVSVAFVAGTADPQLVVTLAQAQDAKLLALAPTFPRDLLLPEVGLSVATALDSPAEDNGPVEAVSSGMGLRQLAPQPADLPDFARTEEGKRKGVVSGDTYLAEYGAHWQGTADQAHAGAELELQLVTWASVRATHNYVTFSVQKAVDQAGYHSVSPVTVADVGDEAQGLLFNLLNPDTGEASTRYELYFRRGHVSVWLAEVVPQGSGAYEDVLTLAHQIDSRLVAIPTPPAPRLTVVLRLDCVANGSNDSDPPSAVTVLATVLLAGHTATGASIRGTVTVGTSAPVPFGPHSIEEGAGWSISLEQPELVPDQYINSEDRVTVSAMPVGTSAQAQVEVTLDNQRVTAEQNCTLGRVRY